MFAVPGPVAGLAGAGVERFGAGLVEPVGEEFVVVAEGGVSRIADGEGI